MKLYPNIFQNYSFLLDLLWLLVKKNKQKKQLMHHQVVLCSLGGIPLLVPMVFCLCIKSDPWADSNGMKDLNGSSLLCHNSNVFFSQRHKSNPTNNDTFTHDLKINRSQWNVSLQARMTKRSHLKKGQPYLYFLIIFAFYWFKNHC